jgi:hypothetical protein
LKGEIKDEANRLHDVPYALENRRLLREIYELFTQEGKRMLPLVMVDPMRNTEAQAKELRKLRDEFPFYGIKMQTTVLQSDIKHLNDVGRVFLELAAEWELPLLIHSSMNETDLWAQRETSWTKRRRIRIFASVSHTPAAMTGIAWIG